MKSYIEINSIDPKIASRLINQELYDHDSLLENIKNKINVHYLNPNQSRRLYAADSGINNAYESQFIVIKSAVVDDEVNIVNTQNIYLFHANNYSSERLKRLLLQINLFKAIYKKIGEIKEKSLFLVDGTITLSVFTPTSNDSKEYRNLFKEFIEEIYEPIISSCIKKNILLLGFLKHTGSMFLSLKIGIKDVYDNYIINSILKKSGDYIAPISIPKNNSNQFTKYNYITFFLNLKNWNYRFELIKQQHNYYKECIENLLFWASRTHYGMNPIFSKADEYSRVSSKGAEVLFNHILSNLSEKQKIKLRIRAKKKTHFGYGSSNLSHKT